MFNVNSAVMKPNFVLRSCANIADINYMSFVYTYVIFYRMLFSIVCVTYHLNGNNCHPLAVKDTQCLHCI